MNENYMCEILVRTKNKEGTQKRRGNVVVVMPDGHDWTPRERGNPDWRIIKIAGLSVEEGESLCASDYVQADVGMRGRESDMISLRKFFLDLDHPSLNRELVSAEALHAVIRSR